MNDDVPIVIDNGSGLIKAGFAGDNFPHAVFPNILSRPPFQGTRAGMGQMGIYFGYDVHGLNFLTPEYPIKHGIVTDWDTMETIWQYTFYNQLRAAPEEHPVLLTEVSLNSKANREKMTQIMFETFSTPAMYLANNQLLSLHSLGYTTGLVFDSGYDSSRIVPIYKGHVLNTGALQLYIGGQQVIGYLAQLVKSIEDTKDVIRYEFVYSLMNLDKYIIRPVDEESFKDKQLKCLKALFEPSIMGSNQDSIHDKINQSILKTDPDIHKYLYSNIVMAGGSTRFPGIARRLHGELSAITLHDKHIHIRESHKYSAWIGGSLMAATDCFKQMCVSKESYDEHGSGIIFRKFL